MPSSDAEPDLVDLIEMRWAGVLEELASAAPIEAEYKTETSDYDLNWWADAAFPRDEAAGLGPD